jgi:hypothetical protein
MLTVGHSWYSPSGAFRLTVQTDENVVLQVVSDRSLPGGWQSGGPLQPSSANWTPVWASNTRNLGPDKICMQFDGNLVTYSGTALAPFHSDTSGNESAFLRVQDDGNMVIYNSNGAAIWSSHTAVPELAPPQ